MGIELPEEIEGWIDFDLYRANVPWLGRNYKDLVQRMNFYLRFAFLRPRPWWNLPGWVLFGLCRLRAELDFYRLAAEMHLVEGLKRLRQTRQISTVKQQIQFKLKNVCG